MALECKTNSGNASCKNIYFFGIILWCQKLPLHRTQQQIWKDLIRLLNFLFCKFYFWFLLKVKKHSWNFVIASLDDGCLFFGISCFSTSYNLFLVPFFFFLQLVVSFPPFEYSTLRSFFNDSFNRPQQLD